MATRLFLRLGIQKLPCVQLVEIIVTHFTRCENQHFETYHLNKVEEPVCVQERQRRGERKQKVK